MIAPRAAFVVALTILGSLPRNVMTSGPAAAPPTVRVIAIPEVPGLFAIWGATGNDAQGHVWVGVSSNDQGGSGSAHLFELDPVADVLTDRGNVVAELERLNLRRAGETQMKIHSRIVQAADGRLYFTSMDESGEKENGSRLPTWGGHLWRLESAHTWHHLAAVPQALIAAAVGGPYVYTLGYFDHVLFQFDTRTGKLATVAIGSAGGHVSRNFFADERGHAFVPRVVRNGDRSEATLVEVDASLKEVGSTPLEEYFEHGLSDSHGIVATQPDGSGGWYFTTGKGRLYHEEPQPSGPSRVGDLGWFHPDGSRYVASLFRDAGSGTFYGVACPQTWGNRAFDWVARHTDGSVTIAPLPYGSALLFPHGVGLYGSMTHDKAGRFYVVGSMEFKPFLLQITP